MQTTAVDDLATRSVVFRVFAQMLGPDLALVADPEAVRALVGLLDSLGDDSASAALAPLLGADLDAEVLERRRVYWFETGRVPPYESSNVLIGSGGHTARLADISGFYNAFGLRASGDRPDHVVAELEFASHVLMMEAEAQREGRTEEEAVCSDAMRAFLRDHLGGWLDALRARLEVAGEQPWLALTTAVSRFVDAEAARRNVIPIRTDAAFIGSDDLETLPEIDELPVCGGDANDESF